MATTLTAPNCSHPSSPNQTISASRFAGLAAAIGLSAGLTCSVWAQNGQNPTTQPTSVAAARMWRERGLESEAFVAETLGLNIHLPAGSQYVTEKIEGQLSVAVSDGENTPATWTLRIRTMTSSLGEPSAEAQVDDLLRDLNQSKQDFKVLSNGPTRYGDVDGRLCFLQRTSPDKQSYVTGWLVLPTGQSTFLVFAVQTLPEYLLKLRQTLNASFATIQLRTVREVVDLRKSRLDAGREFLASITPAKLKALTGQKQMNRIYRSADSKASTPETEIGYSLVEVLQAKRGELDPKKAERDYTSSERQEGLMVRVQSRVVDTQRRMFFDSIALYWMAWDQSEEMWSVRGTQRQGDAELSQAETGLRQPKPSNADSARLKVIKSTTASESVPYEWEVPDGYMSQALGWLVGRLLPRDESAGAARDFAYYCYVPNDLAPKMYMRLDHWAPSADGSGQWTLSTRLTSDTPPFTSIYGRDGSLVRRIHADGSITEPIAVEELRRIWKSKGLDVGKAGK